MITLYQGDCIEFLKTRTTRAGCIIADPPDNLGLQYDGYVDKRPDYYDWIDHIMSLSVRYSWHFWLSYYWQHDLEISSIAQTMVRQQGLDWKKYLWRYTFGQHVETDCGSGFRYILRLSQPGISLQTDGIRVQSARQKMGDPRANPNGRVPDDVWEFPRVVGNSPERRPWHPTQHPVGVYQRIIRMSVGDEGSVYDLFGGTGTLFRALKGLPKVNGIAVEQSAKYCEEIGREHGVPIRRL